MAPAYNASRQGRWILPIPIDLDTEELATFLIVTSLAAGAQHGYGIIADVLEISGGRVGLLAGALYAALDRLRAEGQIDVDREEAVNGRLRRYYRLTPAGGRQLAAEAQQLRDKPGPHWPG